MFFPYNHSSVRTIGRWAKLDMSCITTAAGSKLEIAFKGNLITLHFMMRDNEQPYPHLWLSLDGGPLFESTLDHFIRVSCDEGEHILSVVYKGGRETFARWNTPLVGKVQFLGYDAEDCAILPENNKKTIEFIGDSITEGVLIDEFYRPNSGDDQNNRPYQDDSLATYAAVAAKILDLEPYICGYGAVGTTRIGCGAVPPAPQMYPFYFEGEPISHKPCDFVVINHGTNDRGNPDKFNGCYRELLEVVYKHNPNSKIISMVPFIGAYQSEIKQIVEEFNREYDTDVFVVDASGWVPREPLHPNRESHKEAGKKLAAVLKEKYNL